MDWRRELLQAVRSVFDSERKCLHAQLQDVMATNTGIDFTSLLKHLEMLLQKQVCKLFPVNKNTDHMVSYLFLCDSASVHLILLCYFFSYSFCYSHFNISSNRLLVCKFLCTYTECWKFMNRNFSLSGGAAEEVSGAVAKCRPEQSPG